MQAKHKNWIFKGLLALIVTALILTLGTGHRSDSIATINGKEAVNAEELERTKRFLLSNNPQLTKFPNDRVTLIALFALLEEKVLEKELSELNLAVSDEATVWEIRKIPNFTSKDGKFDEEKFNKWLTERNLSESRYVAIVKGQLAKTILRSAAHYQIPVTDDLVDRAYLRSTESRTAKFIQITDRSTSVPRLNNAEVLSYYLKNPSLMRIPARADVEIWAAQDTSAKELRAIADLARSGKAIEKLGQGVKHVKITDALQHDRRLDPIISASIFKLKAGEVSRLIELKSHQALVVVRVLKRKEAYLPKFEEIQAKLAQVLFESRREEAKMKDALAVYNGNDGKNFAESTIKLSASDKTQAAAMVFSLKAVGDRTKLFKTPSGSYGFYVLTSKVTRSLDRSSPEYESVRKSISYAISKAASQDFSNYLMEKSNVRIRGS